MSKICDREAASRLDSVPPAGHFGSDRTQGDTNELRPDLALTAEFADPTAPQARKYSGGIGMIIEVLRSRARVKRWRIWTYWALFAEEMSCTTAILVPALTDDIARWASRLGSLELPAREALLVLSRHNMPRVVDLEEARKRPAKALVSALMHANNDDIEVLLVAFTAALELPDQRTWRYASAILAAAPKHRRDQLKEQLTVEQHYVLTELERNSVAFYDGHLEGIIQGLVRLVLTTLELRSLPIDSDSEARIRSCQDAELLELWASRARRVASASELF